VTTQPKDLIDDALAQIASRVVFTESAGPDSHTVVVAEGLDGDGIALALARYIVAFLAGWVQRDATIGNHIGVVGADHRDEIQLLVDRIVVPPAGVDGDGLLLWGRTWRNAWIGEMLVHALLLIRRDRQSDCLEGDVVGLLRPHSLPKRQGLDSVAICDEDGTAVVVVGETKTTRDRGSEELTNACSMFDAVDAGVFGPDLRDAIDGLADVLPDHLASTISNDIWREQRCYLPAIVHQDHFDARSDRPRLAQLQPPRERKRVLLLRVGDFDRLFEDVARSMSDVIDELVV
jgi:hypothetical protein